MKTNRNWREEILKETHSVSNTGMYADCKHIDYKKLESMLKSLEKESFERGYEKGIKDTLISQRLLKKINTM